MSLLLSLPLPPALGSPPVISQKRQDRVAGGPHARTGAGRPENSPVPQPGCLPFWLHLLPQRPGKTERSRGESGKQ